MTYADDDLSVGDVSEAWNNPVAQIRRAKGRVEPTTSAQKSMNVSPLRTCFHTLCGPCYYIPWHYCYRHKTLGHALSYPVRSPVVGSSFNHVSNFSPVSGIQHLLFEWFASGTGLWS